MRTLQGTKQPQILGSFEIKLNGHSVSYTLKRSQRARLVWLQIRQDKGLVVTVPRRYNLDELPPYLISKTRWILRHLAGPPNMLDLFGTEKAPQPALCYLGNPLPMSGEDHNLNYCLPDGPVVDCSGALDWLREQALVIIPARVRQLNRQIGVNVVKICIRDQKTRWGSCSQKGNLNFNWRLIMAPAPVLDYVVIHELCHLRRMSHGKSFWKIVDRFCPEWREHRRWLNRHSRELHYFHSSSV
jgi:predicted metal-dependent hydrolase